MSLTNNDILIAMENGNVSLIIKEVNFGNSIINRFTFKRGVHTNNYDFYEYAFYSNLSFFENFLNQIDSNVLKSIVDGFSDSFIASIITSKVNMDVKNKVFCMLNMIRKNRLSNALVNIMRVNSLVQADYTRFLNVGDMVEVALWSDDLNALMDAVEDDEDFFANSDKNYWKLAAVEYRAVKCFDFIANNLRVAS